MIATFSLDIARPPERVYAVLIDQETWGALDPALLDITPRGPVVAGMAGTMTRRVAGRRVTNGWTVMELEPGKGVGMRLTGAGYELIETTTLEARDRGHPRDHRGYAPAHVDGRTSVRRGVGSVHPS